MLFRKLSTAPRILSGLWLATRRHVTFARAHEGTIVLLPSPWYPLVNPLISKVGRALRCSFGVNPFSPNKAGAPRNLAYRVALNFNFAISLRSFEDNGRTSS